MMLETKILHHLSTTPLFAIISLTVATDVIIFSIDSLNNRIVMFLRQRHQSSTWHTTCVCVGVLNLVSHAARNSKVSWCSVRRYRAPRREDGLLPLHPWAAGSLCFCNRVADVNSRRGATSRFSRVRGRKNPEHRFFEGAFQLRKIRPNGP